MRTWLERLWPVRRHTTPPPRAAPLPVTRPWDAPRPALNAAGFMPLPGGTPFYMLQVYRFLRDAIPDISTAVWTWKRLCQTGYTVAITDVSSEPARRRAARLIADLDERVNGGDRGMEGLLDIFYTALFTYGAAALEIVLSPDRRRIHDVVPVDAWTVRFKRERGRIHPYQEAGGATIPLPADRFIYVGLDRDGTNPYGRSMLGSIPFVVKIQQRLMEDMAKATHNAGWAKLHVQYDPGEPIRGENPETYHGRIAENFESLRRQMSGLEADQNIVTYGNVRVNLLRGDQRAQIFYDNHKAVEEQVITGMRLMPILLGRNYGTTETYGTAQFEVVNRHVQAVNRSVRALLDRLYNFELALMWGDARAKTRMGGNRTVDVLKDATARGREIANVLRLRDAGLLTGEEAAAALDLTPEGPRGKGRR